MIDPTPQPVIHYASPGAYPPPAKSGRHLIGWVLFIGLAILLFFLLQSNKRAASDISLSEFTDQLKDANVAQVIIDGETLRGRFVKPVVVGPNGPSATVFRAELPAGTTQSWAFVQWLLDHRQNAEVRVENNQNLLVNLLLPLIPWVLIFAFIWFFVFRQLRSQQAQPKPIPVYIVTPENK